MSSAPNSDDIARDATWLVQALDPAAGAARLVAMDRDSYRAASFLDDRLVQRPVDAQIVPWPSIEEAAEGMPEVIPGYQTDMPTYKDVLSDADIWAVLSFIESTWPAEIRARQQRMNQPKP